jgi:surface carbohydrate biosynthesis protein
MSRQPRIALIVNNPVRDLGAVVLLAYGLCQKGACCYLLPLATRSRELWALAPDAVVLPTFQTLFAPWIEPLHRAGVAIVLHDGEGSPATGIEKYAASCMADPVLRSRVELATVWGSEMAEHIRQQEVYPQARVVETGTMRYDFYAPQWRQAILDSTPELDRFSRPLVMINTHYPRGNPGPGFQSFERIRELLIERGYSPSGADEYIAESKRSFKEIAKLANYLARRFPQATFVFRPHPYEKLETYHQLLEDLPNLHLIRQGTIYGWLLRAAAVVHTGCLTGVEAGFVGIPSLMPRWFAGNLGNEESKAMAEPFDRPEDLADALGRVLKRSYQRPDRVERMLAYYIPRRFHSTDGLAWQRNTDAILELLAQRGRAVDAGWCRDFLYGLAGPRTTNGVSRQVARLKKSWQLPPQWSYRQRKVILDPMPQRKVYELETARRTADAIHACHSRENPSARPVALRQISYAQGDYICPYWGWGVVMEASGEN